MEDRQGAVPGITVSEGGGIMVEGAEAIDYFRLCTLVSALGLEVQGLRSRRYSAYAIAKREYGLKGSKPRVLEQLTLIRDRIRDEMNNRKNVN
jgi:hypothetical protein